MRLAYSISAGGIILGVAAVIAMVSIGEGAKRRALEQLERLGARNIILRSQRPPETQSQQGGQRTSFVSRHGLERLDVRLLQEALPDAEAIVPLKEVGGQVIRAPQLMHGKTSRIRHDGRGVFAGIPTPYTATRYHSLVIRPGSFDHHRFEVSAWTSENEIMGLRARPGVFGPAPLEGVQFHPESFLTTQGILLLANVLGLPRPALDPVPA